MSLLQATIRIWPIYKFCKTHLSFSVQCCLFFFYLFATRQLFQFATELLTRTRLVTTLTAGRGRPGATGVLSFTQLSEVGHRLLVYLRHSLIEIVIVQETPVSTQTEQD